MSLQAMVWVIEDAPDVPAHCVAVLQGLANHADRDGRNAYPSVELLAHYARKSERSVQKDLAELEYLGLIGKGDQRAAYDIPERYRPTVWDLAMAAERTRYVPRRFRDAPSPTGDPGRGEPDDTPAGQGCRTRPSGVNHTTPEPPPNQVGTERGEPPVSRGTRSRPPQEAPDPSPATPGDPEPPATCGRPHPLSAACGGCGDARRTHAAWEDRERSRRRQAEDDERRRARELRDLADEETRRCRLCNDDGMSLADGRVRCTHDPSSTTGQGRAEFDAWRRQRWGTPQPA